MLIITNVQNTDNTISIPLFDVYNNGYHIGGKLNVTYDRHFSFGENVSKHLGPSKIRVLPKYRNRINLSDITMRIGTIVKYIILGMNYLLKIQL